MLLQSKITIYYPTYDTVSKLIMDHASPVNIFSCIHQFHLPQYIFYVG